MNDGIAGRIAEWATTLRYDDIPGEVLDRARLQVASVLGAIFAGSRTEVVDKVRRTSRRWGDAEEASILPSGGRAPLHAATYVNAASSVALDYDDYLFAGHTGHSSVVTSLAFGEMLGSSGRDVITAQVVGNEVAGRLGAAFLLGPHNGQMWTYIHALAGACVAGRFLPLDATAMRHAIGIALAQPPYPLAPSFFGPDSKALYAAEPLLTGIRAAELAADGVTGARDILGDESGFLAKVAQRALPFVFEELGSAWVTQSLAYKLYPGCAYIDTPVDAFLEIRDAYEAKHGRALSPDDVDAIRVEATLFTDGMEQMARPHRSAEMLRAIDVNFSVGLSIGTLLVAGELSAETLSARALSTNRDAIERVASRVAVEHSAEMNARMSGLADLGIDTLRLFDPSYEPTLAGADFARYTMRFPARVTLRTTDGDELTAEADIARGAAGRPWEETVESVHAKFLREARACGFDGADALAAIRSLDEADDIRAVVSQLGRL